MLYLKYFMLVQRLLQMVQIHGGGDYGFIWPGFYMGAVQTDGILSLPGGCRYGVDMVREAKKYFSK